ncbi:SDR family NAD(P)-dependent oxidoreductase [Actinoplanes subtropicus]|uniref:SDR family NAD(P)-dependent oxidoreductase n=1 Tax=Actinoplanes subtropicus TaxID=543632 RepID=UPI000690396D|nr:SDR family NAD(P)-dependent oxidoreductase [Actinoplanes subtropicus]
MTTRATPIDKHRFGPWALVTGASSGIGRAFATQLAANGINLVLAARRLPILDEVGRGLARQHHIQYRTVQVDLAEPDFLNTLIHSTNDLDLGLIVSNAGDMNLGEFLATAHQALLAELRVNTEAHLSLTHHFGQKLARRGTGGILLVSSVAGIQGVPYIANYSATKSYVLTLGEALHRELAAHGVHVTVLVPGATATAMTARFGADKTPMGRLMMSADTCAAQGLAALTANHPAWISGRMNRVTIALTPRKTRIRMFGAMNKSMADQITTTSDPRTPSIEPDDRPV